MTRSRICDVFSRQSRVSALFSALPAISAARRLSNCTGSKILATNYTVFHRYFRAEYRYPYGTAVPMWTPPLHALSSKIVILSKSWPKPLGVQTIKKQCPGQGLSRYLETECPNRGFIDFCVSKVWYKKHTTNKIDPIPLQILLF